MQTVNIYILQHFLAVFIYLSKFLKLFERFSGRIVRPRVSMCFRSISTLANSLCAIKDAVRLVS